MSIETSTKIGLISKALILCGEKPLISLSDDRYGATVGSNLFELIYENELQSNPWRFSMKKAALARLNLDPLNQYANIFQIPADCLLPRFVYPASDYEIYGDRIYTDLSSIDLDYQFKPDVGSIPAHFAMLMTYALARDMVQPITEGGPDKVESMARKYIMQRDRAMYADAQARPNKVVQSAPFISARQGG